MWRLRLRHDGELRGRLFLIGLVGLAALALGMCDYRSQQLMRAPPEAVEARIVGFGFRPSSTRPRGLVDLELADGTRLSLGDRSGWASGCRVGDSVALDRRGLAFSLANPAIPACPRN